MSDKPKRTVEEIQKQYEQGCFRAGHLAYQIFALSKDLEALNGTLRDLNLEAAAASQAEKDAAIPVVTPEVVA